MRPDNSKPYVAPATHLPERYLFKSEDMKPFCIYLQILFKRYAHFRAVPAFFKAAVLYRMLMDCINWEFDQDVVIYGPKPTKLKDNMKWAKWML